MVIVSYDVSTINRAGRSRLRRVAKECENWGLRVQNSVFECIIDNAQWVVLRERLLDLYSEDEDSLRFYFLGKNWQRKLEHHGLKETPDLENDTLLI